MKIRMALLLATLPLLSGCIARAAMDVVTAPVKVVSKTADVLTTSQSEADEKRGRAMRHREERLGKLERQRSRLSRGCQDGSERDCRDLAQVEDEIRAELDRPI